MNIEYLLTKYNGLAHDPILGIITLYVNLIERLLCANSFYILNWFSYIWNTSVDDIHVLLTGRATYFW